MNSPLDSASTGEIAAAEAGVPPSEPSARQAARHQQLSAAIVHEAIRFEGEAELDRPTAALFWSGLAAGLTMGLSLVGQGLLRTYLPDTSWRPLVDSFGYTLGFIFVVAGRQQLFTENTLTPILPLLRRFERFPDVARLWAVVLVANLIGAAAFAWVAATTTLFDAEVRATFTAIAQDVIAPEATTLFIRAVVAGWLIALMVWLIPGAREARLAAIVLPTYIISVGHFAHSIAGSVDVLFLVASAQASWAEYGRYLGVVLAGNILGGVTLVAVLNHAQVVAGGDGEVITPHE